MYVVFVLILPLLKMSNEHLLAEAVEHWRSQPYFNERQVNENLLSTYIISMKYKLEHTHL
jgi:hypothetical protein